MTMPDKIRIRKGHPFWYETSTGDQYGKERAYRAEDTIQPLIDALEEAQKDAAQYIGCRCSIDDCEPGDCWPCRMMGIVDKCGEALAQFRKGEDK